MQPDEIITMTKEELVNNLAQLNIEEEQLMANMVEIRNELLRRLEEENKDGEVVGEYTISKTKRVSFKTTIEQAQELGAVKPAVDTQMLKKMHDKGIEVPGTSVTVYLSMRRLNKKEEA